MDLDVPAVRARTPHLKGLMMSRHCGYAVEIQTGRPPCGLASGTAPSADVVRPDAPADVHRFGRLPHRDVVDRPWQWTKLTPGGWTSARLTMLVPDPSPVDAYLLDRVLAALRDLPTGSPR